MSFVTTGADQVRAVKCCVVFDRTDGQILHTHRVVTMAGADETPDDEVAVRALSLARDNGIDVSNADVVPVDPELLQPGGRYAVDLSTRSVTRVGDAAAS